MPFAKLNTTAWTIAQTPKRIQPARATSVRARPRVSHSPAGRLTAASGSSHAIWPPTWALNSRHRPGRPPKLAPPPPMPPPSPKMRPKPL